MSKIRVFLAGDSTLSYYDAAASPRAGWGQMLEVFMKEEILVLNEAASGRSSKSFIDEGRLAKIAERISKGDYLLIQFGHNDGKSDEERYTEPFGTYKSYLKQYIDTARSKQAFPVLITPVHRRKFNHEGKLQDTHGDYLLAMKQLANECNVPLVDLAAISRKLFEKLGPEESKKIFLWLKPGEYPNYPVGAEDDTHFSEYGAQEIAKLVAGELQKSRLPLASYVKEIQ